MPSNAYFLANFRFDTAENEPAKNLQNFTKFANFAPSHPIPSPTLDRLVLDGERHVPRRRRAPGQHRHGDDLRGWVLGLSKMGKVSFANLWRAHYRLYQNEKLQENLRLTAFDCV